MNGKLNFWIVCSVFTGLFCGCGGNKSKHNDDQSEVNGANDSLKYVKIADSDKFLPGWSKENVIVCHHIGDPDDMHPTNGNSAPKQEITLYTQKYLLTLDYQKLQLRPDVVKAMPMISEDGLIYTYELRSDLKWDDGSSVTVEDILFTYKANKCPLTNNPFAKPFLENLKEIVVDKSNPLIFMFVMKRKYIQNLTFVTDYSIMQRAFFDPKNTLAKYTLAQFDDSNFKVDGHKDLNEWVTEFNSPKYSRDPKYIVGLGPYRFEKWDADQSIILVRKENYFAKNSPNVYETAYPEKIIFKVNRDQNSQILEFKSQAIDETIYLSTKTLLELQKDENFNLNYNSRFTDTYNFSYAAMNIKPDDTHQKFFVDKNVRRAMAYLSPLDDINKVLNKGKNKRMVGPVSPLKPEHNSDLKLIPFNVEEAKKLLDEAGWKDTDGDNIRDKMIDGEKIQFSFNLSYLTTQVEWKNMAQIFAEGMYKAGVKANLQPVDVGVFMDNSHNHNFDMMLGSWAGSSFPEDYTQIWHTSTWASKGSNYTGFGNAQSDALIDSIKYTIEDDKRIPMIKRLQKMIYDEQPYVFMFASLRKNVVHKRFGNCEMYFEKPGILLNNLKLLSLQGGASAKPSTSVN